MNHWLDGCPLERHDRNLTGNGEFGLGRGNDLRRGYAGRKAITAISVTTISIGRNDVTGNRHFLTIFVTPLAVCCIATMTRLAPVTRSMAPPIPGTILPGIIQLAR